MLIAAIHYQCVLEMIETIIILMMFGASDAETTDFQRAVLSCFNIFFLRST